MRVMAIALVALACGCVPATFHCSSDTSCGAAGVCEPAGYCAYGDSSCASGLRYGDLSSSYSGVCVGNEPGGGDGGVDGSSTNDTDGDGVPDSTDNCPTVPNPGQENEDGDKFGDACDPCPPVADNNPPDADGDGVADACDPNPTTPGDHIFLFEGFHHGVPGGWEMVGTWTGSSDDVAVTATTAAYLSTPGPTSTHETVSTSFTVNSATTSGANSGVIDDHAPAGSYIYCSTYWYANQAGLDIHDSTQASMYYTTPFEMTTAATYVVQERRDTTSFGCTGKNTGTGTSATVTTITDALANTPPSIGIIASGSSINFHWLMVVSNN